METLEQEEELASACEWVQVWEDKELASLAVIAAEAVNEWQAQEIIEGLSVGVPGLDVDKLKLMANDWLEAKKQIAWGEIPSPTWRAFESNLKMLEDCYRETR